MGDAEQFKDPKSVSPKAMPERSDSDECVSSVEAGDRQPVSAPLSQSQPPVRRSSVRPAPADYRPSARDPSTLRPMMVVRAGDAEPTLLRGDITDPAPSQRSLIALDSSAKVEPFALAEDLFSSPDPVCSRDTATTDDRRQPGGSNSTPGSAPTTSKPQRYRSNAYVLVGIVLLCTILAALNRRSPNTATQTVQVQAQAAAIPQQPSSPPSVDAPPVANESKGETAAAERATAAASDSISPAASAPMDTTRVTLELKPIDAKVYYLGRAQPGPPFEFDIAKGQRIAVEVKRFGFVTGRVVINDKKPVISFGMLPEHYRPKRE